MKFIITLLVIIIIIGCSFEQSANIKIKPSDVGYDVYADDNELLLEFTNEECNQQERDLLKKISIASENQNVKLKPIKDGYSVSREDGELVLEFLQINNIENSLELLNYIYEVSLEYKNEMLEQLDNNRKE